jgi:outer membrane lipoprotein-sorting protein
VDAEPLGTKQIDEREVAGFKIRLKRDGTDFLMGDISEIWVDEKTKRLVLAETSDTEHRWVSTLKDFIFDQELDDSLFSLELPEGYKDIGPLQYMFVEPSESK